MADIQRYKKSIELSLVGIPPPTPCDEAITAYVKFFQQGISNNPGICDKMHRNEKFSRDMFSLFMYGIKGQAN